MWISNITPPQVWSASSRSLTNIGSGALAPTSTAFATIAAATNVDLRTSAGVVADLTIAISTGGGATGTVSIVMWDGTNAIQMAVSSAGGSQSTQFTTFDSNTVGPQVRNADATVAGHYHVAAKSWTI